MKDKKYVELCMLLAILAILGALVILGICGCEMLAQVGNDPNGPNLLDPNQANALMNAGHAVKSIGIVTANPELVGIGVLLITIAGALGGAFIKKKIS